MSPVAEGAIAGAVAAFVAIAVKIVAVGLRRRHRRSWRELRHCAHDSFYGNGRRPPGREPW